MKKSTHDAFKKWYNNDALSNEAMEFGAIYHNGPIQAAAYTWATLQQEIDHLVEALGNLYDSKRPSYHDCLDDGLPQCEWCDAGDLLKKYRESLK